MVAKCYFELRKPAARGSESMIADAMRHLITRHDLGKTVVVCEQPVAVLSAGRKQWLKLSRSLQKQRSSTLKADKILRYTRTINRMQSMLFTIKGPTEQPAGDVYFLKPTDAWIMPEDCSNIYIMCEISGKLARHLAREVADDALVVDYNESRLWQGLGLAKTRPLDINNLTV